MEAWRKCDGDESGVNKRKKIPTLKKGSSHYESTKLLTIESLLALNEYKLLRSSR